jgi:hypothetical protein
MTALINAVGWQGDEHQHPLLGDQLWWSVDVRLQRLRSAVSLGRAPLVDRTDPSQRICCLVIAPTFYSAANYVLLGL